MTRPISRSAIAMILLLLFSLVPVVQAGAEEPDPASDDAVSDSSAEPTPSATAQPAPKPTPTPTSAAPPDPTGRRHVTKRAISNVLIPGGGGGGGDSGGDGGGDEGPPDVVESFILMPHRGMVAATVVGREAANTLEFGLASPESSTMCGNCFHFMSGSWGPYAQGTPLVFYMADRTTGGLWTSNDLSHARVTPTSSTSWGIEWDDGGGGGHPDRDFNDLIVSISVGPVDEGINYLALGDSFSAGEGIDPFLNSDPYDQPCHRSPLAYPLLITAPGDTEPISQSSDPGDNVAFHSCSGAVIPNFTTTEQSREGVSVPLQINHVNPSLDLITFTVGGNDVKFADILQFCATKLDCLDDKFQSLGSGRKLPLREWIGARLSTLDDELVNLYSQIDQRAEGNASIVVASYPHLFSLVNNRVANTCPEFLAFGPGERFELNNAGSALEGTIIDAASRAGVTAVPVIDDFAGRGVCSAPIASGEWITGVDFLWGKDVGDSSFHPTAAGAEAYARAFSDALAQTSLLTSRSRAVRKRAARALATSETTSVETGAFPAPDLTDAELSEVTSFETGPLMTWSLASLTGTDQCDGTATASQHLVIRGDGFAPGSAVQILLDAPSNEDLPYGTVIADANGAIAANVILPSPLTDPVAGFVAEGTGVTGADRRLASPFSIESPDSECGQLAASTGQLSLDGGMAPAATNVSDLPTILLTASLRERLKAIASSLGTVSFPDPTSNLRVTKASSSLTTAVEDRFWTGTSLTTNGPLFFEQLRQSVAELGKLAAGSNATVDAARGEITDIAGQIATTELNRATAASGDPRRIAAAAIDLVTADAAQAAGNFETAITLYKKAWDSARKAY